MIKSPEYKVVSVELDAQNVKGDAVLLDKLIAKMVANGWTFESLTTPTHTYAFVVFARPSQAKEPA